jgi:putative phosphoribosyl transferase
MRFKDTREAGLALASRLDAYAGREDACVLALATGGVGVGLEVSKRLRLPLDILLLRRLLATHGPAKPLCVASVAGTRFVDEEVTLKSSEEPAFELFLTAALAEFDQRVSACRGERAPLDLKGRTVLLVDNGVRTGSTVRAGMRALRSTGPARVVVAAPLAAPESLASVETVADEFIHLTTPEPFGHVGLWYENFTRPSDMQIRAMLDEAEAER